MSRQWFLEDLNQTREDIALPQPRRLLGSNGAPSSSPRRSSFVSQRIRQSVLSNTLRSVSPPIAFDPNEKLPSMGSLELLPESLALMQTPPPPPRKSAGDELREWAANRRLTLESFYPSVTFGRHTDLDPARRPLRIPHLTNHSPLDDKLQTSQAAVTCRVRHYAVSRHQATLARLPSDDTAAIFSTIVLRNPFAKSRRAIEPPVMRNRKGRPPTPAELKRRREEEEHDEEQNSWYLFDWGPAPVFVNDMLVPPGCAIPVVDGDVIAFLENPFSNEVGILKGKPHQFDVRSDMVVTADGDEGDGDVTGGWEVNACGSPLRYASSPRHPKPLPVFVMKSREASPEVVARDRSIETPAAPPSPPPPSKKKQPAKGNAAKKAPAKPAAKKKKK